ncbi:helix-turn-helix domain-containing protein [Bradyrhizobium genosp. P]|uniref:helix-turn-helix domain-containing protein n=1 Tax=Bradyrhizobium genosp. P TaxID=83641 RepID=UPI003CF15B57
MSETVEPIALSQVSAAKALGISRNKVNAAVRAGELTARRHGIYVVIERTELQRWVDTWPIVERRT